MTAWSPGLLPADVDRADWEAFHARDDLWIEPARAVCARHGLAGELTRRKEGGNIVYFVGEQHVLKIFAPTWSEEYRAELASLELASGRIPAPTPEVLVRGEIDGWPYFVMARLPGQPIGERWATLAPGLQRALARDLGELARALHALPTAGLAHMVIDWPAFVSARRAACLAHHRARKAPEQLVAGLEALLDRVALASPGGQLGSMTTPAVLVHADLADVNVLIRPEGERWVLSGVIDFGDAFVGAREYELVTPGEFLFCGRPDLLRAFLLAYGYAPEALDERLGDRLMALTLLHRFANVGRLARFVAGRAAPARASAPQSLEELRRAAWSFDE